MQTPPAEHLSPYRLAARPLVATGLTAPDNPRAKHQFLVLTGARPVAHYPVGWLRRPAATHAQTEASRRRHQRNRLPKAIKPPAYTSRAADAAVPCKRRLYTPTNRSISRRQAFEADRGVGTPGENKIDDSPAARRAARRILRPTSPP